jgi:hypothetical protein
MICLEPSITNNVCRRGERARLGGKFCDAAFLACKYPHASSHYIQPFFKGFADISAKGLIAL